MVTVALVLGLTVGCNTDGDVTSGEIGGPEAGEDSNRWRSIAPGPLGPRQGTAAVWTGSKVVFVGGDSGPPCPIDADCVYAPELRTEVAAYQPSTNTWAKLPDAPHAVAAPRVWWTGTEVLVIGGGRTMALEPNGGAWRDLGPNPSVGDFVTATDKELVFVSYEQQPGERPVDWRLDLATGDWSPLPRDPFGESYDRSMAWDGERLWLVSMAVENHFAAHEGAPSRLAVLEGDSWRIVEDKTPPLEYEQDGWWFDEQLVIPGSRPGHLAQAYAPSTREWTTLATSDDSTCEIPPAGAGPDWLSGGGSSLIQLNTETTTTLPSCPEFSSDFGIGPDVAVWVDNQLLIWGTDYRRDTTVGSLWQPPEAD